MVYTEGEGLTGFQNPTSELSESHPKDGARQTHRTRIPTKITPPTLANRWGVDPNKVLGWIRSGELRAIDASSRQGGKPRYLIDEEDIKDFEERRAVVPSRTRSSQNRRIPKAEGVIEFFDKRGTVNRRF